MQIHGRSIFDVAALVWHGYLWGKLSRVHFPPSHLLKSEGYCRKQKDLIAEGNPAVKIHQVEHVVVCYSSRLHYINIQRYVLFHSA